MVCPNSEVYRNSALCFVNVDITGKQLVEYWIFAAANCVGFQLFISRELDLHVDIWRLIHVNISHMNHFNFKSALNFVGIRSHRIIRVFFILSLCIGILSTFWHPVHLQVNLLSISLFLRVFQWEQIIDCPSHWGLY